MRRPESWSAIKRRSNNARCARASRSQRIGGVAGPAAFQGTNDQKRRFFLRIYRELENRIKIFTSLRIDAVDSFALRQRVREIGRINLPDERER